MWCGKKGDRHAIHRMNLQLLGLLAKEMGHRVRSADHGTTAIHESNWSSHVRVNDLRRHGCTESGVAESGDDSWRNWNIVELEVVK